MNKTEWLREKGKIIDPRNEITRLNTALDRLANPTPLTDNFLRSNLKCVQDELVARIEYARNRGEDET